MLPCREVLLPAADPGVLRRLLPQTDALHAVPSSLRDVRRLLPQADALRAVPAPVRDVR
jgi:hypothetical protein